MDMNQIPSGLTIHLSLSDEDATKYAANYLMTHSEEIKELIREKIKVGMDITNPEIRFNENELILSCRAGMRLMRVNASARASILWDGSNVRADVLSLDLPVVSIDPSKANELIQRPIRTFVSELQKDFHIRSFRVEPGKISVDAVKI